MKQGTVQEEVVRQLQAQVLALQGIHKPCARHMQRVALGPVEQAFPSGQFPLGAVHEFLSPGSQDAAATSGFISGMLGSLMGQGGACLWISARRTVFPPGLKAFGIDPERVIFLDLCRQKDVLWALEEALKCEALAAVVGELSELGFKESRRLQLAVEQSRVTGFIHRYRPRTEGTVAAAARWKIRPLPSVLDDGLPGVGFPRWEVQLVKVRNGRPGIWQLEWRPGGFVPVRKPVIALPEPMVLKTG